MEYKIVFNEESTTFKEYNYSYGNIKNIKIRIGNNTITLIINSKTIYTLDDIFINKKRVYLDAFKKSFLIHLIINSFNIKINNIQLFIDNKKIKFDYKSFYFDTLLKNNVDNLKLNFSNEAINNLLCQTASTADTRMASLYAFLISKTKKYDYEKFIYLWMSLNGMYNYISNVRHCNLSNSNKKSNTSEQNKLNILKEFLQNKCGDVKKNQINSKNNKKIALEVISIVGKNDIKQFTKSKLLSNNEITNKISKLLKNDDKKVDINCYVYFLIDFAYYFRCNIVHANNVLPIFLFDENYKLKSLKIINVLLEEYIEKNLPLWFTKKYEKIISDFCTKIID